MKAQDLTIDQLMKFFPQSGEIEFCGGRVLLTLAEAIGFLRKELIDTLGLNIAKGILTRYGYRCGTYDAQRLKNLFPWDSEDEWIKAGPVMHMLEGIVQVELEDLNFDRSKVIFSAKGVWKNSFESAQHLIHQGLESEPVCWTLAGHATGYSSSFMGAEVICMETECVGKGDPVCRFVLKDKRSWGDEAREMTETLKSQDLEGIRHLDRLATMGVLSSSFAHEIGTPLNVISARAEFIAEGHPQDSRDRKDATTIIQQTERICAILQRYLDFSKPKIPSLFPTDINRLTHTVLDFLRHRIERGLTHVITEFGDGIPRVLVDPEGIQQVLINVIVNAIEAMDEGGTLKLVTRFIPEVEGVKNGGMVVVEVADTGCGIPKSDIEKIFRPFYSTKGGKGTGLGLAIASKIMRDHSGAIRCSSKPGSGSNFIIELSVSGI